MVRAALVLMTWRYDYHNHMLGPQRMFRAVPSGVLAMESGGIDGGFDRLLIGNGIAMRAHPDRWQNSALRRNLL